MSFRIVYMHCLICCLLFVFFWKIMVFWSVCMCFWGLFACFVLLFFHFVFEKFVYKNHKTTKTHMHFVLELLDFFERYVSPYVSWYILYVCQMTHLVALSIVIFSFGKRWTVPWSGRGLPYTDRPSRHWQRVQDLARHVLCLPPCCVRLVRERPQTQQTPLRNLCTFFSTMSARHLESADCEMETYPKLSL